MTSKIALVTGGSRGLGKDMALSLAGKGLDVVLTYHSKQEEAEQVVSEIQALGRQAAALRLDVGVTASFDDFIRQLTGTLQQTWGVGTFDYLIHNAGFGATIPLPQVTEETFDQLMNVHYKGVYFLTQKTLPILNDNGGIVFISSGSSRRVVYGYSVYASLKGAIEVLCNYVAKEFGNRGIRANVVAPGPIETDFNNAAIRNNPQMKSNLAGLTALGRVGQADDIGGVVAFLCTDDAKWVNAQRIEVSGGLSL
ncbi:SDR family NAD(P)-dependent oxidoreductase [Tellurirhabdus rosea]|uniref:SDR family NAD(P)-dependent oxidoreductase n=1 Tax=Tellurirhabdus rosea TaxID=2674997 RepID=UPI002251F748|nr:SDR family oxidoreductase [Tellurirhabdus rosea]